MSKNTKSLKRARSVEKDRRNPALELAIEGKKRER